MCKHQQSLKMSDFEFYDPLIYRCISLYTGSKADQTGNKRGQFIKEIRVIIREIQA